MEGKAHAYIFASEGCKKWDTCAPEAILSTLGGKLTDMNGERYTYEKTATYPNANGVFATAKGVDHKKLLTKIPQNVKEVFNK